jgi:Uma2 family endonuclease
MSDALKKDFYSYEDWLEMDEQVRVELVDGEVYLMATPEQQHQEILGEIYRQLANFLKGKPCKVFPAPFGVRLSQHEDTVFEPDIVIVCDPDHSKLNGKICDGVPDMVVEILSPSSIRHDRLVKFNRYLHAGVREYWIVDGETNSVQVNTLENGRYITAMYSDTDTVPVGVLEGCVLTLADVFPSQAEQPATQ